MKSFKIYIPEDDYVPDAGVIYVKWREKPWYGGFITLDEEGEPQPAPWACYPSDYYETIEQATERVFHLMKVARSL